MYTPAHYAANDPAAIRAFMERYRFVTLVSSNLGVPEATHVPVLFDADRGRHGTIVLHLARANPQWRRLGDEALVIFAGPHGYVSPSWYASSPSVPTWNYTAVHAYGKPKAVAGPGVVDIVRRLTEHFEARLERPWRFDPDEPYGKKLMNAIVGVEIEITRVEAKFKLNQNKTPEDRERVVEALRGTGHAEDALLAEFMAEAVLGIPAVAESPT